MLLGTQLKLFGRIERHQPGDEHRHVERAGDGFHRRQHPRHVRHRDDIAVTNGAKRDEAEVK